MKWSDLKFIADENIQQKVVEYLKEIKADTYSISDKNLQSMSDKAIIEMALKEERIILTHDSDFGKLIYHNQIPFLGIIYLRPGHIESSFTISSIKTIIQQDFNFLFPFILVAENTGETVKLRFRNNLNG
jgi:predicted nuclease of predicted toxin-antitoxin system